MWLWSVNNFSSCGGRSVSRRDALALPESVPGPLFSSRNEETGTGVFVTAACHAAAGKGFSCCQCPVRPDWDCESALMASLLWNLQEIRECHYPTSEEKQPPCIPTACCHGHQFLLMVCCLHCCFTIKPLSLTSILYLSNSWRCLWCFVRKSLLWRKVILGEPCAVVSAGFCGMWGI